MAFPSKILVAIDFDASSVAALDRAAELARTSGAAMSVLHVYPYPGEPTEVSAAKVATPVEQREWAARELGRLVERAERMIERPVESEVLEGDPAAVIVQRAAAGRHDLIAMGTHDRVGRVRMLAGSIAEAVIRGAPCPVLVVRVPE